MNRTARLLTALRIRKDVPGEVFGSLPSVRQHRGIWNPREVSDGSFYFVNPAAVRNHFIFYRRPFNHIARWLIDTLAN